jgi:hypothetical protein
MDYSTPTLPTVASRIPSLKSRGTVRGNVIHNNRVHVYESGLEQNVLRYFCARPDVAEVIDQPPPVYYVDADGKRHQHTFDFLIELKDGSRHFIFVKPEEKVRKYNLRSLIRLIAAQVPKNVADKVHLITDKNFTRSDLHNNHQAAECLKFPVHEHDALIDRITGDLTGAAKISDLVEVSGLGGMAFRAIVRLIAQGVLVPADPKARILPTSYVSRSAA